MSTEDISNKTTETIIEEATKTVENTKNASPEVKTKDPIKKLKNLVILFGFALIVALLAILIMYFAMKGNATKVGELNERVTALTAQLNSKTDLADKSTSLEQQLKKANNELATQAKLVEEATNKSFKAEEAVKANKDRLTKVENDNANLATAASNAKATAANLQARLDNIKSNLGN